jgi:hypothetical protein
VTGDRGKRQQRGIGHLLDSVRMVTLMVGQDQEITPGDQTRWDQPGWRINHVVINARSARANTVPGKTVIMET